VQCEAVKSRPNKFAPLHAHELHKIKVNVSTIVSTIEIVVSSIQFPKKVMNGLSVLGVNMAHASDSPCLELYGLFESILMYFVAFGTLRKKTFGTLRIHNVHCFN